jgi:hypothetical protein
MPPLNWGHGVLEWGHTSLSTGQQKGSADCVSGMSRRCVLPVSGLGWATRWTWNQASSRGAWDCRVVATDGAKWAV